MAKRIDILKPRELVRVKFHGSKRFGNEPYELDLVFLEVKGQGEDRRAVFAYDIDSTDQDQFEAYRSENRWCYGTSSERLSIVD